MIEALLVTSKEAARLLGISERTLWTLSRSGEIQRVLIGRSVRYRMADLAVFVERRRSASGPALAGKVG
jgi:excisionase family DNA binding protein